MNKPVFRYVLTRQRAASPSDPWRVVKRWSFHTQPMLIRKVISRFIRKDPVKRGGAVAGWLFDIVVKESKKNARKKVQDMQAQLH